MRRVAVAASVVDGEPGRAASWFEVLARLAVIIVMLASPIAAKAAESLAQYAAADIEANDLPGFRIYDFRFPSGDRWRWAARAAVGPPNAAQVDEVNRRFDEYRQLLRMHGPRDVLIVNTSQLRDFRDTARRFGAQWVHPDTLALAFPTRGIMLLDEERKRRTPLGQYRRTVAHEIVHIVMGGAGGNVPRWYHEGLAQSLSGDEIESAHHEQLAIWAVRKILPTFTELDDLLNHSRHSMNLYYRQSLSFIEFMNASYGDAVHARVLREIATGQSMDAAFERATGEPLDAAWSRWRAQLASTHSYLRYLMSLWQPFTTLALICAGGYLLHRIRRRRALARMAILEANEPDQDDANAYWNDERWRSRR